MVIHDFRNPTASIKYGLEDSHLNLYEALQMLQDEQAGFSQRSWKLLELLKASKLHQKQAQELEEQVQNQLKLLNDKMSVLKNILQAKNPVMQAQIVDDANGRRVEEQKVPEALADIEIDPRDFEDGVA